MKTPKNNLNMSVCMTYFNNLRFILEAIAKDKDIKISKILDGCKRDVEDYVNMDEIPVNIWEVMHNEALTVIYSELPENPSNEELIHCQNRCEFMCKYWGLFAMCLEYYAMDLAANKGSEYMTHTRYVTTALIVGIIERCVQKPSEVWVDAIDDSLRRSRSDLLNSIRVGVYSFYLYSLVAEPIGKGLIATKLVTKYEEIANNLLKMYKRKELQPDEIHSEFMVVSSLLESLIERDVIKRVKFSLDKNVMLTGYILTDELLQQEWATHDVLLPMLTQPCNWIVNDEYSGGYLNNKELLINKLLSDYKMTQNVYTKVSDKDLQGLNLLQSQKWVLKEPKNSYDMNDTDKHVIKVMSKIGQFYKNRDIYFPYFMDWRLRRYISCGVLNPVASKLVRWNIRTPEKYIPDLKALKIKFVRHFIDKYMTQDDAVKMNVIHEKYQLKSFEDENIYKMYVEALKGLKSDRLIEYDHTASGWMILTLLFKDEKMAEMLNLTSGAQVKDFYSLLMDKTLKEIKETYPLDDIRVSGVNIIEVDEKPTIAFMNTEYRAWARELMLDAEKDTIAYIRKQITTGSNKPVFLYNGRYYGLGINTKSLTRKKWLTWYDSFNHDASPTFQVEYYTTKTLVDILEHSDINLRKLVKKMIMVIPYQASNGTIVEYLKDELTSQFKASDYFQEKYPIIDKKWKSRKYKVDTGRDVKWNLALLLTQVIRLQLSRTAPNILQGIEHISKIAAKRPKLIWNNLEESTVGIKYHTVTEKTFRYGPSARSHVLRIKVPNEEKYDKIKHRNSIIPNLIHTLDACIVNRVVLKFKKLHPHANILTIHDAYLVESRYSVDLKNIVCTVLQEVLDEDFLKEFLIGWELKPYTFNKIIKLQGDLKVINSENIVV